MSYNNNRNDYEVTCSGQGNSDRYDQCAEDRKERVASYALDRMFQERRNKCDTSGSKCVGYAPVGGSGMGNMLCDPNNPNDHHNINVTRNGRRQQLPTRVFLGPANFDRTTTRGGEEVVPRISREKKTVNNVQGTEASYMLQYVMGGPVQKNVQETLRNPLNFIYSYEDAIRNDREANRVELVNR